LNDHQHLALGAPITIAPKGYIYIWVSNQSEATKVRFDDLTVNFSGTSVAQATDYGVWGDVLRENKTDDSFYRFGYQGQVSERNTLTGWNHFELREYDPIIGRWLRPDPFRQFINPYVGMGNNPIWGVDKNGAWVVTGFLSALAQYDFIGADAGLGVGVDHNGEIGIFMKSSIFTGAGAGVEAGFEFEFNLSPQTTVHNIAGISTGEIGAWGALGLGALASYNILTGDEMTLSKTMFGAGGGLTYQLIESKVLISTYKVDWDNFDQYKASEIAKLLEDAGMSYDQSFRFLNDLYSQAQNLSKTPSIEVGPVTGFWPDGNSFELNN
jgi:RHS repeat-associated protein